MDKFLKSKKGVIAIFILIFLLALFVRAWRLSERGEGMDEFNWIERGSYMVRKIAHGDFSHATDIFERHPGIPAAFLMGVSINFLATENHYELPNFVVPFKYSLKIIDPLIAARIPIVILGALTAAFLYFFAQKIWGPRVGITAGLLLALDPFHIALSRIAHQDVALAFFFLTSLFCYFIGEKKKSVSYKIFAGIFFGFAFLTKIVALLIPLIIFIWKTVLYFDKKDKYKLPFNVLDVIVFLIGFGMFFIFYTEMWGDPLRRFIDHLKENFGADNAIDTHFFMGYTGSKTFLSFYLIAIPAKMTLISLIGAIISLAAGIKYYLKNKKITRRVLFLIITILVIVALMSSFGKMKDRYIIPIWPFLMILSAIGIVVPLKYLFKIKSAYLAGISALIVLAFNLPLSISLSPYHFVYYNPIARAIAGGANNIPKYLEVSWGEGFREAALYLNEKQGIKDASAVSSCQSCFSPYFKGKFLKWDGDNWFKKKMNNDSINYAVISIRTIQRHSPEALYALYKYQRPEKVITVNKMDVIWIYNLKK